MEPGTRGTSTESKSVSNQVADKTTNDVSSVFSSLSSPFFLPLPLLPLSPPSPLYPPSRVTSYGQCQLSHSLFTPSHPTELKIALWC